MLRSIDFSRAGMLRQQQSLDVSAHNLAATSVPGFKLSRSALESGEDAAAPGPLEAPSLQATPRIDRLFTQGAIQQSPHPWDLAIEGEGFFPLQDSNGATVYTRNGSFHPDVSGQLVDDAGRVLQPPLTIPNGTVALDVAGNGTVSAIGPDGSASPLGTLQLARFANPNGLLAAADGVFTATAAAGPLQLTAAGSGGAGTVHPGALEAANTDLTGEMASLIAAQRTYQLNLSAFQLEDQMFQVASQMQPNGG